MQPRALAPAVLAAVAFDRATPLLDMGHQRSGDVERSERRQGAFDHETTIPLSLAATVEGVDGSKAQLRVGPQRQHQ